MPLQVQRHGAKCPVDAMRMYVHAMRVSRLIGRSSPHRKIIFILFSSPLYHPDNLNNVHFYQKNIDDDQYWKYY